jgi:hypothetical protein
MMTRRSGFKQTNVPAQERTIVKVAKVWLGDDAFVTIYAQGRKGFERRDLYGICARVRNDLNTTTPAYYSASRRRASLRWQLHERVPDQNW